MNIEKKINGDLVSYNPVTGVFRKYCTRPNRHVTRYGWLQVTARDTYGYPHVSIAGKMRTCHRLAFEIMGVIIPDGFQIDHIDGVKDNNAWDNLRIVTPSENRNAYRDNHRATLPRNVTKAGRRYRVEVMLSGKRYRPYFDTVLECVNFIQALQQFFTEEV